MSNPNPPAGGPPLRALAMVLIALAIVFAGLGAMSLSHSTSSASVASATASATPTAPPAAATSAPPVGTGTAAAPPPPPAAPPPAPPPPPAAAPLDKSVPVRVLNNSTVAGLAARVGGRLSSSGWNVVETGNYASGILPKTTVYYGNSPGEKAVATAVAEQLGATAQPRFAGIVDAPAGVIVIVTGE